MFLLQTRITFKESESIWQFDLAFDPRGKKSSKLCNSILNSPPSKSLVLPAPFNTTQESAVFLLQTRITFKELESIWQFHLAFDPRSNKSSKLWDQVFSILMARNWKHVLFLRIQTVTPAEIWFMIFKCPLINFWKKTETKSQKIYLTTTKNHTSDQDTNLHNFKPIYTHQEKP